MAYIKITSHRARYYFERLNIRHFNIASFRLGHFTIIADAYLSEVLKIKGIKKVRKPKGEFIKPI